jgi:hypothetical protein
MLTILYRCKKIKFHTDDRGKAKKIGASSTNKTDSHDITEILLKVALNTIKQTDW